MASVGERRQAMRWRVPDRQFVVGAWHRQRSNNAIGMGEALPPGGALLAFAELDRPGPDVVGYRLFLYSDGQGWVGGTDSEGLPVGLSFAFDQCQVEARLLSDGRLQPTGDPLIFYHRSSKIDDLMVKIGHTTVSGYYARCYTWIAAYACTEEWDGQHWREVAA
jgi:hypothetical protein